jgi:hypothetical protein
MLHPNPFGGKSSGSTAGIAAADNAADTATTQSPGVGGVEREVFVLADAPEPVAVTRIRPSSGIRNRKRFRIYALLPCEMELLEGGKDFVTGQSLRVTERCPIERVAAPARFGAP